MLSHLHILNFAIIKELDISFENGLVAITGETGAGKSILLGALKLLLGDKADGSAILNNQEKCIVEARFTQIPQSVTNQITDLDIDVYSELIIRREVNKSGRSRAFINDSPVNLQQLTTITEQLFDIHSQFDSMHLRNQLQQLQIVDEVGNAGELKQTYSEYYKNWQIAQSEVKRLQEVKVNAERDLEYKQYLLNELTSTDLEKIDLVALENEIKQLEYADEISVQLQASINTLQDDEHYNILAQIKRLQSSIASAAKHLNSADELSVRIAQVYVELKDIAATIEDISTTISSNPALLDQKIALQQKARKLLSKHNVADWQALLLIKEKLTAEIDLSINVDKELAAAKDNAEQCYKQCVQHAQKLSKQRTKAAKEIELAMQKLLPQVGLPQMQFQINIQACELNANGADEVSFLIDANKQNKFLPIGKAASGGELGRVLLCLKTLLAQTNDLPTLIFDEIDTGISGTVAKQVASLMLQLSNKHQLITITHLPQIASKAKQHCYIYKQQKGKEDAVNTYVSVLSEEQHVQRIAQMIGGNDLSDTIINTAKELIKQ